MNLMSSKSPMYLSFGYILKKVIIYNFPKWLYVTEIGPLRRETVNKMAIKMKLMNNHEGNELIGKE